MFKFGHTGNLTDFSRMAYVFFIRRISENLAVSDPESSYFLKDQR